MVKCRICGREFQNLSSHVSAKHNMSKVEYLEQFPTAEWISPELSVKFSTRSKRMHKKLKEADYDAYIKTRQRTCDTMRKNKGDNWTHSEKTKQQMSASHIGKTGIVHTKETKEKLRKAKLGKPLNLSDEVKQQKRKKQREAWAKRKQQPDYQDYLKDLSNRRKSYIKRHGITIKKENTNIEQEFQDFLNEHKIEFVFQYLIEGKTYDFFIPSMNLLVETDGEYWHRLPPAMKNDLEKHEIAKRNNLELLRISSDEFIPEILFENQELRIQHTRAILIGRGHNID